MISTDIGTEVISMLFVLCKWAPYWWWLSRVQTSKNVGWKRLGLLSAIRTIIGQVVLWFYCYALIGPPSPHEGPYIDSTTLHIVLMLLFAFVRALEWRATMFWLPGWSSLKAAPKKRWVWRAVLLSYATDVLFLGGFFASEALFT